MLNFEIGGHFFSMRDGLTWNLIRLEDEIPKCIWHWVEHTNSGIYKGFDIIFPYLIRIEERTTYDNKF